MPLAQKKGKRNSQASRSSQADTTGTLLFGGKAHELYNQFAKNGKLLKGQLAQIMHSMSKQRVIRFVSEKHLTTFINEKFKELDKNHNQSLDLAEFLEFYAMFLDEDAAAMQRRNEILAEKIQQIFADGDADGNFDISRDELRTLLRDLTPPNVRNPTDAQLDELIDRMLKQYDANKDGKFNFQEFGDMYNHMIDELKKIHMEIVDDMRKNNTNLLGMTRQMSETDVIVLEERAKNRHEKAEGREAWVAYRGELLEVIDKAYKSDKMTLLLNHPDHELDQVTQVFKKMATPTLLDVQQLALAAASGEMTDKDACGKIRDAVLEAMEHGGMLVLRLGHSAPDFMLGWNMKNVLPLEFLEPISAKPGPIAKDIACMVSSRRGRKSTKDKPTKEFIVDPKFRLVITSQFHMDNFREFLRGKLPLHWMQPVQFCDTLLDVCKTLENGLPADNSDEIFDEMDRLAALL